ncbi:MAG: alpha/beta fold hydrolase [Streptosporangiales bacterium]|nr:alpha/beta fold hydrolase [Streptosporangiales bacterium]
MSTFVLVPGFWLGGWAWRDVTRELRGLGHDVYPVTLTGLGERAHLAGPGIDLETHVADILGVIRGEDLDEVILVGHSGGGAPVTVAADRLPDRVARVVYVDSGPPADGVAWLDMFDDAERESVELLIAGPGGGTGLPLPPWDELEAMGSSLDGIDEAGRERFARLAAPQPVGTVRQAPRLGADWESLPKTLISSSFPLAQVKEMIETGHPMFAALDSPEWRFAELPTGHWPMFSRPGDLAALLAEETRP